MKNIAFNKNRKSMQKFHLSDTIKKIYNFQHYYPKYLAITADIDRKRDLLFCYQYGIIQQNKPINNIGTLNYE